MIESQHERKNSREDFLKWQERRSRLLAIDEGAEIYYYAEDHQVFSLTRDYDSQYYEPTGNPYHNRQHSTSVYEPLTTEWEYNHFWTMFQHECWFDAVFLKSNTLTDYLTVLKEEQAALEQAGIDYRIYHLPEAGMALEEALSQNSLLKKWCLIEEKRLENGSTSLDFKQLTEEAATTWKEVHGF